MAFPLATALIVAGVTPSSALTVLTVAAAFVAHEPLQVLLGRRGQRALREERRRATAWLTATGAIAIAAGIGALTTAPPAARWSFVLPIIPAAAVAAALAAKREKTTFGEVSVAIAFAAAAVPVCLAAGGSLIPALVIAIDFAVRSSASTLGVRVVILKVRGGGDPRAMRSTRAMVLAIALIAPVVLLAAVLQHALPWAALIAVVPGLLLAVTLAIHPPPPTRLRAVGWTLMSISVLTTATLVAAL